MMVNANLRLGGYYYSGYLAVSTHVGFYHARPLLPFIISMQPER